MDNLILEEFKSLKCQLCGWEEVILHTGNVPLEVHHIDGDYTNNKEEKNINNIK